MSPTVEGRGEHQPCRQQLQDLFISHAGKGKARYYTPILNALATKQYNILAR